MATTSPARRARTRRPARAVGTDAKAQRRDKLLAAAKATFAAKGFHATTIGDIAKAAGVSYGSIYWYFESKDALFHALMDHQEQALREHIERSVADMTLGADGEAMFSSSVRVTFELFEADRDIVKLLFVDSLVLGDRFDRHLAKIFEGFIADIEVTTQAAQAAGWVIEAPPRMIAFSVAALISR